MRAQNCNPYPVDTPTGVLQPGEIGEVAELPANLVQAPAEPTTRGKASKEATEA